MNRIELTIIALLFSVVAWGQVPEQELTISILTCGPGDELYAAYGHTAIRVRGLINDEPQDLVYNYGTFEFDDTFVWKFTQGKLNYMLSRQKFPLFQYEYLMTNRSVSEQILGLKEHQATEIFRLLEENYLPENRYYLYDFFYDNCATRVRDIFKTALGEDLVFVEETAGTVTFRDLIHHYQEPWPWTNFGIDLALGMPCDKVLDDEDDMFLPDYLFDQFGRATLSERPLVVATNTILIREIPEQVGSGISPAVVLWAVFGVFLVITLTFRKKLNKISDYVFLHVIGLLGVFLVFLWFFTDHRATVNNLNLLWSLPFSLVFLWTGRKWRQRYFKFATVVGLIVVVCWWLLPQEFNAAAFPLALLTALASLKQSGWLKLWGDRQ